MKNMKTHTLAALLVVAATTGCHIDRHISLGVQLDIPNDIRARGFRYIKKGIEARHVVEGVWPAVSREKITSNLNVAQIAYSKLWHAAGSIKDDQRLVNVVVEVSLVYKRGIGDKKLVVVQMYADLIEFDVKTAGMLSRRFGSRREAALRAVALIHKGINRVLERQKSRG
jgi:hypothetical protein